MKRLNLVHFGQAVLKNIDALRSPGPMLLMAAVLATAHLSAQTQPYVTVPLATCQSDLTDYPWMNTALTPSERATLLLNASTLGQQERWLDEKAANNPSINTGGVIGRSVYPTQLSCTPYVNYADGPYGVVSTLHNAVTAWPSPLAVSATWNTQLEWQDGQYTADEAFKSQDNGMLSPGVNMNREPRWGRNSEMMSEDPVLTGTMAAWMSLGLQTVPNEPVMADLKHWVGYEQETNRNNMSTNVDTGHTLHELYGLAFEIPIKLLANQPGGVPSSVMCAYPMINETWNCQNPLMNTELKNPSDIGFGGYVVTDFGAPHSTAPSLNAGMDQELNTPNYYSPTSLAAALTAGTITTQQIYNAALRVTTSYFAAGLFDTYVPATLVPASSPAHQALAEEISEQAQVLLKNNGVLPLHIPGQTIAIIGETASSVTSTAVAGVVPAGVSADSVCTSGGNSPQVSCPITQQAQGSAPYPYPYDIDPLDAITARAAELGDTVVYASGSDLAAAEAVAETANVVIVFGYNTEAEGTDLLTMTLDGCSSACMTNGDALIEGVAAANPNTVVVLETGNGAVLMPWVNSVPAIVEAWYPGVEQGYAMAALLFGDVNFQGKTPVTFPAQIADLPTGTPPNAQYPGIAGAEGGTSTATTSQVAYSEGIFTGYRWYDAENITPLFPFGYGLSYTTYSYSNLNVVTTGSPISNVAVTFTVTNTGKMAGTEIAQVYLAMPPAVTVTTPVSIPPPTDVEPIRKLEGWTLVTLNPGQSKTVTVNINPDGPAHPLSYWSDITNQWVSPTGTFGIYVGPSSRNLPLLWKFKKLT